jgi:hypothetical protein
VEALCASSVESGRSPRDRKNSRIISDAARKHAGERPFQLSNQALLAVGEA